jgi:malate dehydrogenase
MSIAVFGAAGGVGAATAAALVTRGVTDQLILVDRAADLLAVQGMDLRLLAGATGGAPVRTSTTAAGADVIVMTAGVPHRDGHSRLSLAGDNLAILDELLAALPPGWAGTLMIATNPVDVLVTAARRALPAAATVMGYVRNDSFRLAEAIGAVLGRPAAEVVAWVIGEHGPGMVPLFDRVTVAGVPVALTPPQRDAALRAAVEWYDVWQRYRTGRTSVWTTGHGLADLVAGYLGERPSTQPVCLPVDGRYGIAEPVCLGLPARLGGGRVEVEEWPLAPDQIDQLHRAAAGVAQALVGVAAPGRWVSNSAAQ